MDIIIGIIECFHIHMVNDRVFVPEIVLNFNGILGHFVPPSVIL